MAARAVYHQEFLHRLGAIPVHGLGLSVDIHSPDLTTLRRTLHKRQVPPAYLEVFHSTTMALASTRKEVGHDLLAYHGEGLWITQPGVAESNAFRQAVSEAAEHLQVLQSAWLNHECAAKFVAGYYYGTYLPPLYTRLSADVVAENANLVQSLLDQQCRLSHGGSPLLLLEMPPLTYFVAGTISIPTFFRVLCEQSSCGLVLDVGHLWTVFRYSGAYQDVPLPQFVETFLNEFPMDRVVEIHVAGLDIHESTRALSSRAARPTATDSLPAWTDAHAAPIPSILFEMLDQILSHPRLTSLRGLALEVDTKPVEMIADEFVEFSQRYAWVFQSAGEAVSVQNHVEAGSVREGTGIPAHTQPLEEAYVQYARVLVGKAEPTGLEWTHDLGCAQDLGLYRSVYLPYEILHWGGELEDMFVESCRRLRERGVSLEGFVAFWFREAQPLAGLYDFFLLKVDRFVAFVREVAADLVGLAEDEAEELRRAYHHANEPGNPVTAG